MLVAGFGGALAVWCAWFAAPLPWVALPENLSIALAGIVWLTVTFACLRLGVRRPTLPLGIGAGVITAAVCVIPLLSTLRPAGENDSPLSHPLPTDAWKVVVAFFLAGGVIGGTAALLARSTARPRVTTSTGEQRWLARFAIITAVSVAPLLFFGGLVTSTNSGMAVPDWPTTFGAQMFFYPMGSETNPDVYLEHTHRLFGTLVGLTAIILLVWTAASELWTRPTKVALAAFVLVGVQGVLGGQRVIHDNRLMAMVHGVLAQLVFAVFVALAVYLTPAYQRFTPNTGLDPVLAKRLKRFATALMHALILQLILGALARHFRKGDHALWTHAAFSIIIVLLAAMLGFAAAAIPREASGKGFAALRRSGVLLVAVVVLQFILGWAAFAVRGADIKAATTFEALIRTAHQANGALLLAAATLAFVWSRWAFRSVQAGRT